MFKITEVEIMREHCILISFTDPACVVQLTIIISNTGITKLDFSLDTFPIFLHFKSNNLRLPVSQS